MTVSYAGLAGDTAAIDTALKDFFDQRRTEVAAFGPDFLAAVTELERFVLRGGKRIRPLFAYLGWIGAGGDPATPTARPVLTACAAFELLHAWGLIHDDIIDASATRRGHPAAHIALAEHHRTRGFAGDPRTYGTGTAILIGDLAHVWADVMVRASGLTPDTQTRITPIWSAVRQEVLYGQLLDLTNQAGNNEDINSALRVNHYKTASYTVERPLQFGAAIAAAPPALTAAYTTFGTHIGQAFQLRDDLLGVFGDPAITGKPSGDDLREGKRTALLATALNHADHHDPTAAAYLRTIIGTDLTPHQLHTARHIITTTGAIDTIEEHITHHTRQALTALHTSTATTPAKTQLAEMAIKATQRAQ